MKYATVGIYTASVCLSTLQSGARFRCYPDLGVASLLRRWVGCQRAIYNGKVEE